jgi:Fe-S-cluster containining protein
MGSVTAQFDREACGERLERLARSLLAEARQGGDLAGLLSVYVAAAEEEARSGKELPLACRAGCPACCVLNVTVLLPEAVSIARFLGDNCPPPRLNDLIDRFDHQRRLVRWLSDEERVRHGFGCPLLDRDGNCIIHPVRPLACRSVTSMDSERCREALQAAGDDEILTVPMVLLNKQVMDEAFCALGRALASHDMTTRGIELSAGVWAFLTDPGLDAALLAGDRLPEALWE